MAGEEFDHKIGSESSDCCKCEDRDRRRILSDLLIAVSCQIKGFDWLINQEGQENLTEERGKFIQVYELSNNDKIL